MLDLSKHFISNVIVPAYYCYMLHRFGDCSWHIWTSGMMMMMKACRVQVYVHVATAYSLCFQKKSFI